LVKLLVLVSTSAEHPVEIAVQPFSLELQLFGDELIATLAEARGLA
jgi:hypothetical protein